MNSRRAASSFPFPPSGSPPRRSRSCFRFGAIAALLVAGSAVAQEASEPAIVRVEEDWVVAFGVPDPDNNAPQVTTVVSPTGGTDGVHMVFDLNHISLPEYDAGGMQLQVWSGEHELGYRSAPNANVLTISDDVAAYTTSMSVQGCSLRFEIKNGTSQTWGSFGGNGTLRFDVDSTLTHLGGYDPAQSAKNSRVGFAGYRVRKLSLKQVRYYSAAGLVATDSTERVVHEHNPASETPVASAE